jgi:hypothetical protein
MAAQTVIKLRRSTAATWTSTNPTLGAGEQGLETDTGKVKIGNGTTAWTSLAYSNPGGTVPQSQVTNLTTDLSGKQASITGAATTVTSADLTASRALTSNSSGKIAVSSVTDTELSYVSGVTSAIQTQLGGKASSSHTHGMADLTGFTITSPTAGQSLTYDGSKWVNGAAAASGEVISSFLLMGA